MIESWLKDMPSILTGIVVTAAVLSLIGLPLLLRILWRLREQESRNRDLGTASSVWSQVDAFEKLREWEANRLRQELDATEQQLRTVLLACAQQPYDGHVETLAKVKEKQCMWFSLADRRSRRFYGRVRKLIGTDSKKTQWEILGNYSKLLAVQLDKFGQAEGKVEEGG